MPITINGTGTITGISVGGLPDAIITQPEMATGVAGTGPAFIVIQSATTSLSSGAWTKITFTSESYDTNSNYDTTNSRFTPTVAGFYQLNTGVTFSGAQQAIAAFYKNGSQQLRGFYTAPATMLGVTVSGLVYMNGSTDYVEVYVNSGSAGITTSGDATTWFNGFLARAA
jgi:hypothetical protein